MASGEDEKSDHDSYLAGRGDLCLICEENPVYALPLSRPTQCSLCEDDGMYVLWFEGCRCFTCPECYDAEVHGWRCGSQGSYEDRQPPAPSPIPLGALGRRGRRGGCDGGKTWVGRMGTHISHRVDGVWWRRRSQDIAHEQRVRLEELIRGDCDQATGGCGVLAQDGG